MDHLYFLLGLTVLVLIAFLLSLRQSLLPRYRLPYVADEPLFTPNQRAFLAVLERALGQGYRVYGRVRVADVVGIRARIPRRWRERAYERIGERCFDFLICEPETSAIVCGVNLAPRSRLRRKPPRDTLDRICAAARLPFVRFRESDVYSVMEVEERVFAAMQGGRAPDAAPTMERAPSPVDADAVLKGLSEVIEQAGRRGSVRARPVSAPPAQPLRTEPVFSEDALVDDGPRFRIEGDLEEDHPVRARRP